MNNDVNRTINGHSLWIVVLDMPARTARIGINDEMQKQVVIKKGQIIEFRYHHGVHFRTIDDEYCFVEEQVLFRHCDLYGRVLSDIAFENQKTLREILDDGLYIDA